MTETLPRWLVSSYWWWPAVRGEGVKVFLFYVQVKGFCEDGQGGEEDKLVIGVPYIAPTELQMRAGRFFCNVALLRGAMWV